MLRILVQSFRVRCCSVTFNRRIEWYGQSEGFVESLMLLMLFYVEIYCARRTKSDSVGMTLTKNDNINYSTMKLNLIIVMVPNRLDKYT